jgi:hypothetical protein
VDHAHARNSNTTLNFTWQILDFAKCKAQMPSEKKRLLQQLAIFLANLDYLVIPEKIRETFMQKLQSI